MKKLLFAILSLIAILSCKKDEPKVIPTVTIKSATNITATSATSGGEVTSSGGTTVTARGVCWSTNPNPSTSDSKTLDGSNVGSFVSIINGLVYGKTYYVRAYATNEIGTAYSSQTTFNSLTTLPVLTTSNLSSITSTSITTGGVITSDGGAAITAEGVCWSTTPSPTVNNNKTIDGTNPNLYSSLITSLEPNTTYYIRAYATNNVGTAYGNELTTTTLAPVIIAYKTMLQYNSSGKKTKEFKYVMYSKAKDWINYLKIEYSYNSQGFKIQNITSNWDNAIQNWIYNTKDTYSFFVYGQMWEDVEYRWDASSGSWIENSKYTDYKTDNRDNMLFRTYRRWDNYNYRWEDDQKYQINLVLDNYGRISKKITIAYSDVLYGYYGNKSTYYYKYDTKGNVIDTSSPDGGYEYTTSLKYDNNGNPTEKLTQVWNSALSKYVDFSKIIYTYDSSGNQIEYIEYIN